MIKKNNESSKLCGTMASGANSTLATIEVPKILYPLTDSEIEGRYDRDQLFTILWILVSYNSPHGYERLYHDFLPPGGTFDSVGNYIVSNGDSTTLFCCHMDTVGGSVVATMPEIVDKRYLGVGNKSANCLGGDDKCGFLILKALFKAGVKGTYIFHVGEERGCVGAKHLKDSKEKLVDFSKFKRAIEFDRRGTTSVITRMMSSNKVCSKEFADELSRRLGMDFKPDPTGSYTDVYQYSELVPEVTNISCGYSREHGTSETIDVLWLLDKMIPKLYEIDWETLPVVRDHTDKAANTETYSYSNRYTSLSSRYDAEDEAFFLQQLIGSYRQFGSNFDKRSTLSKKDKCRIIAENPDIDEEPSSNHLSMTSDELISSILGNENPIIIKDDDDIYMCEHCNRVDNVFHLVEIDNSPKMICQSCIEFINFSLLVSKSMNDD